MMLEPGQPCPYCQVRPDVACRHRPADETWKMGTPPPEKPDNRRNNGGGHYSAGNLNGTRTFTDARTGKVMTIRGRGD